MFTIFFGQNTLLLQIACIAVCHVYIICIITQPEITNGNIFVIDVLGRFIDYERTAGVSGSSRYTLLTLNIENQSHFTERLRIVLSADKSIQGCCLSPLFYHGEYGAGRVLHAEYRHGHHIVHTVIHIGADQMISSVKRGRIPVLSHLCAVQINQSAALAGNKHISLFRIYSCVRSQEIGKYGQLIDRMLGVRFHFTGIHVYHQLFSIQIILHSYFKFHGGRIVCLRGFPFCQIHIQFLFRIFTQFIEQIVCFF